MSEAEIACRCSRRNQALWSYCPDDFYCPQCGEAITRLVSKNRYPPDAEVGPIWIYAQKGKDSDQPLFAFPLAVKYADQARLVQRRKPTIDFQQSKGAGNQYFSSSLQLAETGKADAERLPNRPCRVQLIPLGIAELPSVGVRLSIPRLVGDFSRAEQLELRVGNKPSVRVELTGPYLEQSKDCGNQVRVTDANDFDVILKIHAEHAPILIEKPLNIYCGDIELDGVSLPQRKVSLRLEQDLVAGTEIIPGNPWSTSGTLYATALTMPGQKVKLDLSFDVLVASIDQSQLSVTLERVEKGGADFNPDPLSIAMMYLGECRSNALCTRSESPEDSRQRTFQPVIQRLSICNVGRERIILDAVSVLPGLPFEWLYVDWATDVSEGTVLPEQGRLELEPHARGEIYVRVDLRKVRPDQLLVSRSLSAVIQVRQVGKEEPFKVPLTIREVRERSRCPGTLCIDFGNTSSFASVKLHKDFPDHWSPEAGIADVHDLRLPESFPTALFFKDADENVFESDCEIGNLALEQAEKFANSNGSAALVTDLKRWIGSPTARKSVCDPRDHAHDYLVSDLIILFLKCVIERAELILRRYAIQEICVSHPSKFDAGRRRMFHGIIDRLCELVTRQRPSRSLKRVTADVDEANCVAVGTVFEPEFRTVVLRELLQQKRRSLVIGCFDLGGGSLDIAVMRFGLGGSYMAPRYTSEYLGIGGHSGFGGDNVTLAFMECILDRIRATLEQNKLKAADCLKCVPSPVQKDSCSQTFMRRNYQLLWEVAERVKIYQCRMEARPASPLIDQDELESLNSFVQTRLVNDLILIPRIEGKIQADPTISGILREFVKAAKFLVPLSEVYQREVQHDLSQQARTSVRYSVQRRIEDAMTELQELADGHAEQIDIIILAGAGSRLPLVTEMVRHRLPNARIIHDHARTKFRVAHGLVRFLEAGVGGHSFACSSHYSTFAYEVGCPDGASILLRAIPNCAPLRRPDKWYRIRVPGKWTLTGQETDATISEIIARDGSRRIHVFRIEEDRERTPYGWFDLTFPPYCEAGFPEIPLTEQELLSEDFTLDIRLTGLESEMELRVNAGNGVRGIWKMIPVIDEKAQ